MVLGLVGLVVLVLTNLPSRTSTRLKLAIGSLFLPLIGLVSAAQQTAGNAASALAPRGELIRQNEALRHENQQLRLQAIQAEETARENERLRQVIGWQKQNTWKAKLARVILRDPANWWRTVQIDLGSRDGLRENLPVLANESLVGRVSSVSLTHAQVVLLGDSNCKVAARVDNEAHDSGIIGSGGPFDASLVRLACFSRTTTLKPGQNVLTSGDGGIFPKGIPIGKIVDFRAVEYGLFTEARVKLAANLGALEEVWVMMP